MSIHQNVVTALRQAAYPPIDAVCYRSRAAEHSSDGGPNLLWRIQSIDYRFHERFDV